MISYNFAAYLYDSIDVEKLNCIMRFKDDNLKGMGTILRVLYEADSVLSVGEIAKKLRISTARAAVALNTLKNKGFVEKHRSSDDGRNTFIKLTDEGRYEVKRKREMLIELLGKHFSKLSDREIIQFKNIIEKLLSD